MFHDQLGFDHPHPPLVPEAYFSPSPRGPFIINSQTPYDESIPTFYQGPLPMLNEALNSPCVDTSLQIGHSEPYYPPNPRYLKPSYQEHKITPPPREIEKSKDEVKDESTIERLLELKEPEKPPKLIRIFKSNKPRDREKKSRVGTTETGLAIHSTALQAPFKKGGQDQKNGLEREVEDGNETHTTELTLDSEQTSDSDQSYKGTQAGYLLVDRGSVKSRSRSPSCSSQSFTEAYAPCAPSATSRSRSRSCSSHSCTGAYASCVASNLTNSSPAAKKTKSMCLKIEDYVRDVAYHNSELSEELIKQVIEDMSLDKALKEKLDTMECSGSRQSGSPSPTPTCSSKPI